VGSPLRLAIVGLPPKFGGHVRVGRPVSQAYDRRVHYVGIIAKVVDELFQTQVNKYFLLFDNISFESYI
jgi:hypothetical protein